MISNYTLQDIFGSLIAVVLFSMVFVFPGYLIGWVLNLFDFRNRLPSAQIIFGITFSNAFSPIILFLAYRFASSEVVVFLLNIAALIAGGIYFWKNRDKKWQGIFSQKTKYQQSSLLIMILWVIFSIFILAEIQIKDRLYFNANSYDMITRVAMVDAITRTGVPPVNPSYFPGHSVPLNYLYYFWYILGSVVDELGGQWVSAYHAMIASISWCGIAIFSTVATYLRVRNNTFDINPWKNVIKTIQFLAIGGLDFIFVIMIMIVFKEKFNYLPFEGRVEGWNMPIMSWINAVLWVPHHVAAALACMTALMIFNYYANSTTLHKIIVATLVGLAFASAFGLSVWVMFVFSIFWIAWMTLVFIQRVERISVLWMALGGFLGLVFAAPFLVGLLQSNDVLLAKFEIPVVFYVRPFTLSAYLTSLPRITYYVINFLFLPINYLFELGFFFFVAMVWIFNKQYKNHNRFYVPEMLLVATVTFLMSFLYSNIIVINDLGIRGWLPLQFVLLVWAGDVFQRLDYQNIFIAPRALINAHGINMPKGTKFAVLFLLTVGLLTTLLEVVISRTWPMLIDASIVGFPNELSPDTYLGERTYYGRLAYDYLRDQIPSDAITQSNPHEFLDHSSGVYGTHQMTIASRTSYGVPPELVNEFVEGVGVIFTNKDPEGWQSIDRLCSEYWIDVLIFKDTDPVWDVIDSLNGQRSPLYSNQYYAVYACGDFSKTPP